MWEALSVIFVAIAILFFVWTKFAKKKKDDAVEEAFVCPNCGAKHCDCYKHTR